uniref:Ig-like domain-containing protein n=1 Tax=Anser brachyrhynchus TaxID=132585 RepID=A0A8B9CJM2_9AVES
MFRFVLFRWIMMQIFIVHTTSETVVRGVIGQPVRLPCFYQVAREKDVSDMCWGRGPCPNSKCNNKILHTTGNRVTFRKSQRYNLQGYISYGDVSLMIREVRGEDAGTYCCRIEIPGWFNDIKQNIKLVVARAHSVKTTTMRKTPTSPKRFRKTTLAPQATSGFQGTTEAAVLVTTDVPLAATATTESPAVEMLETIASTVFDVTPSETFPEAMVTNSALPDFSTGFQAADVRTEDDDVFCSTEPIPLPEVTTEFPSMHLTTDKTERANTSLVMEDVPTVAITLPVPTALQTQETTLGPSETSTSSDSNPQKVDVKLPLSISVILSVTLLAVSILLISMLTSLLWKRKHTRKFILKSLRPAEDLEKVFSGAEGENNVFVL